MPQQLLHHLELSPHASQQGRVGVTERMPSESLLNSDSLSCRTYVFAQDRLAPVRSSASIALACKNPVLRPDVGTTFSPLRQSVRESRMHPPKCFRKNGGDDETRTRDLCRDRIHKYLQRLTRARTAS